MTVRFTVDAQAVIAELDRLAKGPDPMAFESILMSSFAEVSARVHVITGVLRGSGHPQSGFDGDTWTGKMSFVRHPGIFELARGDTPTANHPEGGHHFYEPAYRTPDQYKQAVMDFLGEGR